MRTTTRLYRDVSGQWRWTIRRGGRVVAASTEGYRARARALLNLCDVTGVPFRVRRAGRAYAYQRVDWASLSLLRLCSHLELEAA